MSWAAGLPPSPNDCLEMLGAGGFVAPDLTRPIIGYREWVHVGDELLSPLARTPWEAKPMQAECLPSCREARGLWRPASAHLGPAPDPRLRMRDLRALHTTPAQGRERLALVRGAVVLWGRIELHQRGMRAEFARIIMLALPESRRRADAVVQLAEVLDVEAVRATDLPVAALAYGEPLERSRCAEAAELGNDEGRPLADPPHFKPAAACRLAQVGRRTVPSSEEQESRRALLLVIQDERPRERSSKLARRRSKRYSFGRSPRRPDAHSAELDRAAA